MMKKIFSLIIILALAINLAACGSNNNSNAPSQQSGNTSQPSDKTTGEPEYTLQLAGAYSSSGDTPRAMATQKIKELIEKNSNGKIKVEIYLDNQLGGDREITEGCQQGNIAMVSQTTAPQVTFIPKLAIFDMPLIFDNLDIANKVLSGPFRDKISQEYEKAGFKLLLMTPIYYRETTTNKAINKIDDFKGIKIRTMENKYHLAFWKALGANPTPLNFNELYVALQQGTVDAQENPYEVILASKFYEVQKYVVNTHHIAFLLTIIMNKQLYDSMPSEYQKIIDESMNEVSEYLFNESKAQNDQMLAKLKDNGMNVIELSPDLQQKMKEAATGVYDLIRKDVGDEFVDELMKAIDEAKK